MLNIGWRHIKMSRVLIPLSTKLKKLKIASFKSDEDKVNEILEDLEDEYHTDLTDFYGEDFDDRRLGYLKNKLKGKRQI